MEPLGIPGEELPGVIDALRFIADYKTTGTTRVGRRVVIVGGGNTAIDAATAARRLGAESVSMFYRRGEPQMPAFSFEVELAKQEGVTFHWQTQPVAIHGDGCCREHRVSAHGLRSAAAPGFEFRHALRHRDHLDRTVEARRSAGAAAAWN